MNKREANALRDCIIRQYASSDRIAGEFTTMLRNKFGMWALSTSEIMELDLNKPELYFMAQMAKLARLMGCSESDSMLVGVKAFASNSKLIDELKGNTEQS